MLRSPCPLIVWDKLAISHTVVLTQTTLLVLAFKARGCLHSLIPRRANHTGLPPGLLVSLFSEHLAATNTEGQVHSAANVIHVMRMTVVAGLVMMLVLVAAVKVVRLCL